MALAKFIYAVQSILGFNKWEFQMQGDWFCRFTKDNREMDVFWNYKIKQGLIPENVLYSGEGKLITAVVRNKTKKKTQSHKGLNFIKLEKLSKQ